MLLFTAILFVLAEAIGEGLLKRLNLADEIFDLWVQWVIALLLFGVWLVIALQFNEYFVPVVKLILGFVFVRFAIFDIAWNLSRGVEWNYYGTTKLYDRVMYELGEWGWMAKGICGLVGVVFLLGIE
jgi:uncharacterized membrane protein YoaK (UPF0700 family)